MWQFFQELVTEFKVIDTYCASQIQTLVNWWQEDAEEQGRVRAHYGSSGFRTAMLIVGIGFAVTGHSNTGFSFQNYWSFSSSSLQ